MEYRHHQASSVAISQKLSNGHSIYDGVFSSAPSKFNVSSFSSRVDDYGEIFGAQRGGSTSIPVLEVPELHERKASIDVRTSKLDYSNVFGGFADSDFAVPYEELFAEPKKKERRTPAEKRSPEEANASGLEGNHVLSNEASYQSFDGAKKFNMSYHKSSHRSKSFSGGTTRIAELHAVPAYTCVIDESTPLRANEGDKPVPSAANGAITDSKLCERVIERNDCVKATRDHLAGDAGKLTSSGGANVQNNNDPRRSNSNDELFNGCGIGEGTHPANKPPVSSLLPEGKVAEVQSNNGPKRSNSNDELFNACGIGEGTRPSNKPAISSLLSEGKVEFEKHMASKFRITKSENFEVSDGVSSPPYFGEEVEANSTAAASVDALRKAIEEAQARINMAKELKERKKSGLQNRVKLNFDNGAKLKVRKEEIQADKASVPKERKTRELREEVAVPVHVSMGTEQVTAAFVGTDTRFGAKEAGGETEKESKSTPTGQLQEEAEVSEAAEQFYEFADIGEPEFSEAADQFYEFADMGEPDVSEPVELFYEFSDSSELQATTLEHEESNTEIKMMLIVNEDERATKKTTTEAFEIPELGGDRLQTAEDEHNRELEDIFNAYRGPSKCEEHASESAIAQEAFDQEENEKRLETSTELAFHANEIFEDKPGELEKQKGDNERLEPQELQETRHVERKLLSQEWVEYEKIAEEACEQEEHEREQKDVDREDDNERRINKDSEQGITKEALNDFNNEEYFKKRDEIKSKVNEELQHTRENEEILEGAGCQKEEFEVPVQHYLSSEEVKMQFIDLSAEDENVNVALEDLKNPDCSFEAPNNLCSQGESEDLNKTPGHAEHVEYDKDAEETLEVPVHEQYGGQIEVTESLFEIKENRKQSETVEEDNGVVEKEIHETDGLAPGVKLVEIPDHMEDATEIHSSDENEIPVEINDMSFGPNHDYQLASEPEVVFHQEKHMEESVDVSNDMVEAEVSANQEENKNKSKSSHRKRWFDKIDISETLIKLKENGNQSESVEEESAIEEKEMSETDVLAPGVKLAEILKQMEDAIETHPSDENDTGVNRSAMNYGQQQNDQLAREPVEVCNTEEHVEKLEEITKDTREAEATVNQEENKNSKSSHRKRWFGDGDNTEVAQLSHILRRKAGNVLLDHEKVLTEESETIGSSLNELEREKGENCHTTLTAEGSETDGSQKETTLRTEESGNNYTSKKEVEQEKKGNSQETLTAEECETRDSVQKKVELEKEHQIQKAHAKGKERERVKEKKAVERVIREARERAFAEARERAAETRQRAAEAQERLGKTSVQANDSSLAEKASKEAKLKAERAAVERATVEARDRALEKALSGKAAYEGGKQAKRSVSGASRDDGMKPVVSSVDPESKSASRYPNSSNQGDPYSGEKCGVTNGEPTQRNKAVLERNQRTAERAAKALAEKNMRDLLVQKEQAERNRLAEALDAEVKRWSSGKERNLRALLSTLQYILGPDSGWQPIPLTDVVTAVAVKKAYRKAALFVHPDKLQQRGASIQQKYTCEKVFDLLKEAWNRFNVEER